MGHPSGPDGRSGPHAFVDDIDAPNLAEEDQHHLRRVLRLNPGDAFTVSDGRGAWRPCVFGPIVEPTGEVVSVRTPGPALTVGFALTKGAKPELVVQKLTELGIDNIVPFVAERSVARWDSAKSAKQHTRLMRIAREAAMQSRRVWLPTVHELTELTELAPTAVRAEHGGMPLDEDHTCVLIGPEGGWSPYERTLGTEVHLPGHVLRAETAAIAAAVLMAALRDQQANV